MAITCHDVKMVYGPTTEASDAEIQAHIDTANMIVSENLAGSGLSEVRLDKIRAYLAAHYLFLSKSGGSEGLKKSKIGESEEQYFSPKELDGTGFASTAFGSMALVLDTSGLLGQTLTASKPQAQFRVV